MTLEIPLILGRLRSSSSVANHNADSPFIAVFIGGDEWFVRPSALILPSLFSLCVNQNCAYVTVGFRLAGRLFSYLLLIIALSSPIHSNEKPIFRLAQRLDSRLVWKLPRVPGETPFPPITNSP